MSIKIDITDKIESLVSQGHPPDRARRIAMRSAATSIARGINSAPSDTLLLADRVRSGEATILQLVAAIERERGLGRDAAFMEAERLLRKR